MCDSLPTGNKLCTATAVNTIIIHTAIYVVWIINNSRARLYIQNI